MRRRAWNLRLNIIFQRGTNVVTVSTAGPRYSRSIIVIDSPTMKLTMKSTKLAAPMVIVFSMTLMQTSMGAINKLSQSTLSNPIAINISKK